MEIQVECSQIYDWESFHDYFFHLFGFSGDYDHTVHTWIEVMQSIDDEEESLCKTVLPPGENLDFLLIGTEQILQNAPDVLLGFVEAISIVNQYYSDAGNSTRLNIVAT